MRDNYIVVGSSALAMTGQKKKRRRPTKACGHRRRRTLVVASVFTLAILLSCCRAVDADNSNINSRGQSGDLLSNDTAAFESEDHVNILSEPKVAPVKAASPRGTRSDDSEGTQEEEMLPSTVATPSNVATGGREKDDVAMSSGAAPSDGRPGPGQAASALSVDTTIAENQAASAQLEEDTAASEGVVREPTRAPATAAAAAGAIPSFPDSAHVDLDDLANSDQVVAADAAADTAVDTAAPAAAAAAAEGVEPDSHQHDMNAVGVNGDDGAGEGVHVSSPLDTIDPETSAPEADALVVGTDIPVDEVRHGDEQTYAALVTGEEMNKEEEVVGGEREDIGQSEETSQLAGEETEEGANPAPRSPPVDHDRDATAGVEEASADGHENDEVKGSALPELNESAVVLDDVDADEHGLDGAAAAADAHDAGVGPVDAIDVDAASSAIAEDEQQQQWHLPPSPPEASTSLETGLPIEAQASVTAAAAVVEPDNPGGAPASTPAAGDSLKEEKDSGDDGHIGGSVDVDVTPESSLPFGTAGPDVPSTSVDVQEDHQPAEPQDGSSPSTDITTAVVADESDVLPRQVAAQSHGGGGGGGGDDEGDVSSGDDKDRGADVRPFGGSEKASSQPESSGEDIGAPPSYHSSSGSRRGGRNGAGGHDRYGGGRQREQEEGMGGGRVEKNRFEVVGGVGGDGDPKRSGNGGAHDVTEHSRGSPEELAQRVRDVEAEVVRKLLAEEDAKSFLDIWVEQAREYVLTQTVPPTDAECDFSWSRLRCEPKCTCGARLRFGDYTPGRACRLLHPWERSAELCGGDGGDGNGGGGAGDSGGVAWDPSDEPALKRVLVTTASVLGRLRRAYEARIAPPSDPECGFSLETRRCEPHPLCRLRLRWGDLSLNRACRLAAVTEKKK